MAIATDLIKNPSSGVANITLGATGGVTFGGAVTGSGMDLITTSAFSAAASVSINNCFSSAYANYRIILIPTNGTIGDTWLYMRLRASGVDDSANTYDTERVYQTSTTLAGDSNPAGDNTKWTMTNIASAYPNRSQMIFDVCSPALTVATIFSGVAFFTNSVAQNQQNLMTGLKATSTSYDGLTIYTSGGTASGTVRVYGYKNS